MSDDTLDEFELLIKQEFLDESGDLLSTLSDELEGVSEESIDSDALNSIFRIAHTLKGNSKAAGFPELSEITHSFEAILHKLKDDSSGYHSKHHHLFFTFLDEISKAIEAYKDSIDAYVDYSLLSEEIDNIESVVAEEISAPEETSTPEETQVVPPETIDQENFNLDELKVICIDDEEDVLETLGDIFEDVFETQISSAADGKEGLEILASKQFDLIITDYNMPHVNGFDLIKELRSSSGINSETPVILLTAYSPEMSLPENMLKNLFFLEKPFSISRIRYYVRCAQLAEN
jgi:chemotaxis protein histidine kinase CheA